LKPKLLLELQRTHRRHRLEVGVEARRAHPQFSRHALYPQRLVKILTQLFHGPHHPVRLSTKRRQVPQPPTLWPD